MSLAATFLAGAKSRLLPASIPFRFFAAAAVFHVLMWAMLLAAGTHVPSFRGGLGAPLAALHLLTLGVLTTTAIGASVQLLPVATRRALVAIWPIKVVFWLTVPGIALMAYGMLAADTAVLGVAAAVTSAGLSMFAVLLGDNLRRAGSLPVVAAYGWAALAALVLLAALGLALVLDYELGVLSDHEAVALAHMILGGFGFMGLLALGFSHVLVPMFALSAAPSKRLSFTGFGLAVAGVVLGTFGALVGSTPLLAIAALVGLGAAGAHLWIMRDVLERGMRKRLGLSFVLIRAAWGMLLATLLVGLAALFGVAGPNGGTLFGLLLVAGWLLTFLLGVLQRILPFLASMHAPRAAGGSPPLLSELAASRALQVHAACHAAAVATLAAAIVLDAAWLVRLGAAVGLAGALAFAWFTAEIVRRLAASAR
jgi:hypothetical protein